MCGSLSRCTLWFGLPYTPIHDLLQEDFAVSEEEMKAWQEKQLKRDQLSNMMGEYLLKGYRMLDSYCSDCGVSVCWGQFCQTN